MVISHESDLSLCVKGVELPDVFDFTYGPDSKYDRVDAEFERHLFYSDLNHPIFSSPSHDQDVGDDRLLAIISLFVPILQCTTFRGASLISPLELLNFISLKHLDSD